ncbi:MAG: ComF family protein, partial [Planctomycetes bacterium]|nr:ComF family protein [Planctomycetota bacterium]
FACKGAAPLQVVLVDDVRTTGSSLQESSRALRAMGARDVRALVLASPPLRRLE